MATARSRKSRSPTPKLPPWPLVKRIRTLTRTAAFDRYLKSLLIELCQVDTTPRADVGEMRRAEEACFRILERELGQLSFGSTIERRPIDLAIQYHPHYSLLHFTKTPARPEGLTPEETYAGRSNLLCIARGSGRRPGQSIALNAHLDVVAPYFSPRFSGGIVHGRGACDDKGPVVAVAGALKVLSELMARAGVKWNRNVVSMFVVEEETGGNGSLSLAIDRGLRQLYDSVLVCECTGLKIHPANRGAVWYRVELEAPVEVPPLEMAAFVIEEMENEGTAIRAESRHALFPQRPVQTCHGIIGPFGEHPSRICGQVSFRIQLGKRPPEKFDSLLRDCLEAGLGGYTAVYGDKTKVRDPATGKPMVTRHFDLRRRQSGYQVDVHGAAGHMGAVRDRDGAITKMAHLVQSLVRSTAKLQSAAGHPVWLELPGMAKGSQHKLVLEGGQGFVPTHSMEEVMERLRQAARRGAAAYLHRIGHGGKAEELVRVTYEKLHNVAFDGDPDSPSVRNAIAAAKACGFWKDEPVLGWTVSCDARLFASENPGMPVLTFGPGQLACAHSDHEQIAIAEVRAAVEFLAVFLLRQTGTLLP